MLISIKFIFRVTPYTDRAAGEHVTRHEEPRPVAAPRRGPRGAPRRGRRGQHEEMEHDRCVRSLNHGHIDFFDVAALKRDTSFTILYSSQMRRVCTEKESVKADQKEI